jgi:hypothetical protein
MTVPPFLPLQLPWLFDALCGQEWPAGDEDALRRCSQAWYDALKSVADLADEGDGAAMKVLSAIASMSAADFEGYWAQYTGTSGLNKAPQGASELAALTAVAVQCQNMTSALYGQANEVEYTKLTIDITIVLTAIQILFAIASSVFSMGGSLAEIPLATFIGRQTVLMLLSRFLQMVAMMIVPDLIAQGVMLAGGDETSWDWGKTGAAAENALAGGVIATFLGAGMAKLPFMGEDFAKNIGGKVVQGLAHFVEGGATMDLTTLATAGVNYAWADAHGDTQTMQAIQQQITVGNLWHQFLSGGMLATAFYLPHTVGPHGSPLTFTAQDGKTYTVLLDDKTLATLQATGTLPDQFTAPVFKDNGVRAGTATFNGPDVTINHPLSGPVTADLTSRAANQGGFLVTTHDGTTERWGFPSSGGDAERLSYSQPSDGTVTVNTAPTPGSPATPDGIMTGEKGSILHYTNEGTLYRADLVDSTGTTVTVVQTANPGDPAQPFRITGRTDYQYGPAGVGKFLGVQGATYYGPDDRVVASASAITGHVSYADWGLPTGQEAMPYQLAFSDHYDPLTSTVTASAHEGASGFAPAGDATHAAGGGQGGPVALLGGPSSSDPARHEAQQQPVILESAADMNAALTVQQALQPGDLVSRGDSTAPPPDGQTTPNAHVAPGVSEVPGAVRAGAGDPPAWDGALKFTDTGEAMKYAERVWGPEMDRLSPEQRAALLAYTGEAIAGRDEVSYQAINRFLNGKIPETPQIRQAISLLDQAMNVQPVPEDVVVNRTTTLRTFLGADGLPLTSPSDLAGQVGTTQQSAGYTSTHFGAYHEGGEEVALHLMVPEGTPAMYLGAISHNPSEHELLLARGMSYVIDSAWPETGAFGSTTWHVQAHVTAVDGHPVGGQDHGGPGLTVRGDGPAGYGPGLGGHHAVPDGLTPVDPPSGLEHLRGSLFRSESGLVVYDGHDYRMLEAASHVHGDGVSFIVDMHAINGVPQAGTHGGMTPPEFVDLLAAGGWDGRQRVVLLGCDTGGPDSFAAQVAGEIAARPGLHPVEVIAADTRVWQSVYDGELRLAGKTWSTEHKMWVPNEGKPGHWFSHEAQPDGTVAVKEVPFGEHGMPAAGEGAKSAVTSLAAHDEPALAGNASAHSPPHTSAPSDLVSHGANSGTGGHSHPDFLQAAAVPGVDLTRITPPPVWRTDQAPVFRFEDRPPEEIFAEGFEPFDVNGEYDIQAYISFNHDSPYVSTTRAAELGSPKSDPGFHYDPYMYEINAPYGIDVKATLGFPYRTEWQKEVLFPGGVDARFIAGVHIRSKVTGEFDQFVPNPGYDPTPRLPPEGSGGPGDLVSRGGSAGPPALPPDGQQQGNPLEFPERIDPAGLARRMPEFLGQQHQAETELAALHQAIDRTEADLGHAMVDAAGGVPGADARGASLRQQLDDLNHRAQDLRENLNEFTKDLWDARARFGLRPGVREREAVNPELLHRRNVQRMYARDRGVTGPTWAGEKPVVPGADLLREAQVLGRRLEVPVMERLKRLVSLHGALEEAVREGQITPLLPDGLKKQFDAFRAVAALKDVSPALLPERIAALRDRIQQLPDYQRLDPPMRAYVDQLTSEMRGEAQRLLAAPGEQGTGQGALPAPAGASLPDQLRQAATHPLNAITQNVTGRLAYELLRTPEGGLYVRFSRLIDAFGLEENQFGAVRMTLVDLNLAELPLAHVGPVDLGVVAGLSMKYALTHGVEFKQPLDRGDAIAIKVSGPGERVIVTSWDRMPLGEDGQPLITTDVTPVDKHTVKTDLKVSPAAFLPGSKVELPAEAKLSLEVSASGGQWKVQGTAELVAQSPDLRKSGISALMGWLNGFGYPGWGPSPESSTEGAFVLGPVEFHRLPGYIRQQIQDHMAGRGVTVTEEGTVPEDQIGKLIGAPAQAPPQPQPAPNPQPVPERSPILLALNPAPTADALRTLPYGPAPTADDLRALPYGRAPSADDRRALPYGPAPTADDRRLLNFGQPSGDGHHPVPANLVPLEAAHGLEHLAGRVFRSPAGLVVYDGWDHQMLQAAANVHGDGMSFLADLHGIAGVPQAGGQGLRPEQFVRLLKAAGWDGRQRIVLVACGSGGEQSFAAQVAALPELRAHAVEVIAPAAGDRVWQVVSEPDLLVAGATWSDEHNMLLPDPARPGRWLSHQYGADGVAVREVPVGEHGLPARDAPGRQGGSEAVSAGKHADLAGNASPHSPPAHWVSRGPHGAGGGRVDQALLAAVGAELTHAGGLGPEVAHGGFGSLHDVPGHPDLLVKVALNSGGRENAQLAREAANLEVLSEAGLPTAYRGLVHWQAPDGQQRTGILMERVDPGALSKALLSSGKFANLAPSPADLAYVNARTVQELRDARDTCMASYLNIEDIQFMVASDGSVRFIDPARLHDLHDLTQAGMTQKQRKVIMTQFENRMNRIIRGVQEIARRRPQ